MILVTGAAGYIGSHCALSLLEKGEEVIMLDNLSTGNIETIEALKKIGKADFVQADLLDKIALSNVFKKFKIDTVIHFAALSQVGESVIEPQKYYENNVIGTLNLVNAMTENDVKKIVFSSTAAVGVCNTGIVILAPTKLSIIGLVIESVRPFPLITASLVIVLFSPRGA